MRALFHADPAPPRVGWLPVFLFCALIAAAYVRTAAITEDAFITFRVIDNALHGHGLVWNAGERVQPYTHPLWALLLLAASAVSGEIFHTALALSLALTLVAAALIARNAQGRLTALWALLALLFSESFIEYSSASLENALAHVLVAALAVTLHGVSRDDARGAWRAALCAGLLAVTRHDLVVLAAPAVLGCLFVTRGRDRWRVLLACALPLVAWSAFALVYYGSIWPNSAYAKLNNGLSLAESFAAARPYFADLIKYDAVTAVVIVAAIVRGLLQPRWQLRVLAAGLALYMAYLGVAGGDYMGGRLFSPPFVLAVTLLALSVRIDSRKLALALAVLTVGLGLQRGWIVWDVYPHAETRALSQHAWMYPFTGWLSPMRVAGITNLPWGAQGLLARNEKHAVVAKCAVGVFGFNAGPGVHIVDPLAITDSFLARLPSKKPAYPGHFERALPAGYFETAVSGRNEIADPALRALYTQMQLLAKAPLWDGDRLQAIWSMNTGGDRRLVAQARYDPNQTFAPGLDSVSHEPLSCMGRLDPLLTVRLK